MTTFPTARAPRYGYDRQQVDDFFAAAQAAYQGSEVAVPFTPADIQAASFDMTRGGYQVTAVDAALDRVAAAFVARTRAAYIQHHGQDAWLAALADQARTLYPRLGRPAGQKFAPAASGARGYATAEVDAMCDRISAFFDSQTPLTAAEVREATFTRAKGGTGYAEGPVDAFLARAVEVLLGVE